MTFLSGARAGQFAWVPGVAAQQLFRFSPSNFRCRILFDAGAIRDGNSSGGFLFFIALVHPERFAGALPNTAHPHRG
jgi:hypothetical protein